METVVRKIGNSQGITISKPICDELGIGVGSKVNLAIDGSCLVISPINGKAPQRIGIARGQKLADESAFSPEFEAEIAALFGVEL